MKKMRRLLGIALSFVLLMSGTISDLGTGLMQVKAAPTTHELALNVTEQDLDVTIIRKDTEGNPVFADIVKEDLPKNAMIRLNLDEGDGTAGYEISYVKLGSRTATLSELGEGQTWDVDAINNTLEVVYAPTMNPNDSFDVTFYDYDYSSAEGNGINNEGNYPQEASPEQRIGIGISGDDYHVNGVVTHPDWGINTPYGSDLGGYNYGLMVNVTNPKTGITQSINANQNNGVDDGTGYGIDGTGWPLAIDLIKDLDGDGNPVWGTDSDGNQIYDPGLFTNDNKIGKTIYTKDTPGLNSNSKLNFKREGYHYVLTGATVGDTTTAAGLNNPRFYPLDNVPSSVGQKFVDPWVSGSAIEDTDPHNWYFGIRHEFDFTLGEYVGELNYKFEGDDDVWVFLDGELVLDLGGVHCVYPSEYNNTQEKIDRGENAWNNEVDLWEFIKDEHGNYDKKATHHVTILYMERGGYDSNCYMEFTVPVNPPANFGAAIDIPVTVKWVGLDEATGHGNNPTTPDPTIYLLDGSASNQTNVDAVEEKLNNYETPSTDEYVYGKEVTGGISTATEGTTVIFDKASLDDGVTQYTALATQYEDFDAVVTGNMSDGFVVTYTYNPQRKSLEVQKKWMPETVAEGEIEVRILANGVPYTGKYTLNDDPTEYTGNVKLNSSNNWKATIKKLLVRENGSIVNYSLEEVSVPAGFRVDVAQTEDSITVTNSKIYSVDYRYETAPGTTKTLPTDIIAPEDDTEYLYGDTATIKQPASTTYTVSTGTDRGTWTFEGYKEHTGDTDITVTEDTTLVGVWSFDPEPKYPTVYEFTKGDASYPDLPPEVLALKPDDDRVWYNGETATDPVAPKGVSVNITEGDHPGVWTFESYTDDEATVTTEGAKFTGTWKFTPYQDVNYVFVKEDGTDWTAAEKALLPEAPASETALKGSSVTVKGPSATSIPAPDNSGTWEFVEYKDGYTTGDNFTLDNDVTITGVWRFVPNYKVSYEYVAAPGETTPFPYDEINEKFRPVDSIVKAGSSVTPVGPKETVYETEDGYWSFNDGSYDPATVTAIDSDVTFVGTWSYRAKEVYKIKYVFKSIYPGKTLPESIASTAKDVKATLPAYAGLSYGATVKEGNDVQALNLENTDPQVPASYDDLIDIDGVSYVWSFVKWETPNSYSDVHLDDSAYDAEMDAKTITFIGDWTLVETPVVETRYRAEKSESSPADKDLPTAAINAMPTVTKAKQGTAVEPAAPTETLIVDPSGEGEWTFKGYKKYSVDTDILYNEYTTGAVGAEANSFVLFTGIWDYTEYPKYDVTYKYTSDDPQYTLPASITAPNNVEGLVDGTLYTVAYNHEVGAAVDIDTREQQGVWTFEGYEGVDYTSVTMDSDKVFNGVWHFTPKNKVKLEYEFVSVTPGKELPTEIASRAKAGDRADKQVYVNSKNTVIAPEDELIEYPVDGGTWVFQGYKTGDESVNAGEDITVIEDTKVVGEWKFVPIPTYPVTYQFESLTAGKTLPTVIAEKTDKWAAWKTIEFVKQGETANAKVPSEANGTNVYRDSDGVWEFVSFKVDEVETNAVTDVNAPVTFVGGWKFTPNYKVSHTFTFQNSAGHSIPDEINAYMTDPKWNYGVGKGGTATSVNIPAGQTVEVPGGVWTFEGFKVNGVAKNTVENVSADVKFVGMWTYADIPTCDIPYEFQKQNASDPELPAPIMSLLPATEEKQVVGDPVNAKVIPEASRRYENETGVWEFVGWDEDSKTAADGEKFVGTWKFTPKYGITYEYVSENPTEHPLPSLISDTTPSTDEKVLAGTAVYPVEISTTEYKDPDDTKPDEEAAHWHFLGFTPAMEIANSDVHFVGTWRYVPRPTVNVTYRFVLEEDPATEVPVEAIQKLKPYDTKVHYDEHNPETVNAQEITPKTVKVDGGIWKFVKYVETTKVADQDIEFVALWKYTPTYDIPYSFEKSDPSEPDLPEEVLNLLPDPEKDVPKGEKVTAGTPTTVSVETEDGVWVFDGWDEDEKTSDENVKFTGTWKFVPKCKVTYQFESTTGEALPEAVLNLLPEDVNNIPQGTDVHAVNPDKLQVEVGDDYWIFDHYDKDSITVNKDEVFTGYWRKESKPACNVTYNYVSVTIGRELPDEIKALAPAASVVPEGTTVNAGQPAQTIVEMDDGFWSFMEYDKDTAVADTDVEFKGFWVYTSKPAHTVVYNFTSSTPGKELPEEIVTLTPDDFVVPEGRLVNAEKPAEIIIEKADGYWVFEEYDKESAVVNDDIVFSGTWKFVSNPARKVTYTFVSGTPGQELPEDIMSLLPRADVVPQGTTVSAERPTAITIELEDGTWTFTGYDNDEAKVQEDTNFSGTWTYTAKPIYKVGYTFSSGTSGKDLPSEILKLLPSDNGTYANGTTITPEQLAKMSVETSDGVWQFVSWDKAGTVIDGANVFFGGVWIFTAKQVENKTTPVAVAPTTPVNTTQSVAPKTGQESIFSEFLTWIRTVLN